MKITDIKPNPNNPRIIKDDKFQKLVKSIQEFPEMMAKRPIVCVTDIDGKLYPLGGNMRLKAIQELKYKTIPDEWIILADDWTQEQRSEFVIKDNIGYGEWNWDDLANNWDTEKREEWGLDTPNFAVMPSEDELIDDLKNKPTTLKITFESPEDLQQAEIDIRELIDRKYPKAFFSVSAGEL